MSGYKEFYGKGALLKYFPDSKTIILIPKNKIQFLKLKSKIDTLLQIDGTKRVGNTFSLKLSDTFNVNVDEVLKSLGMKGGIEKEDASSLVDDATKEADEEAKKLQSDQATRPMQSPQGMPPIQPELNQDPNQPPIPESLNLKVYNLLFEDFYTPQTKQRRKSKRTGQYWKALESFSGKNRGTIAPQDILEMRKKFSLKPRSQERNTMLQSLDRAATYFFSRIEKLKGPAAAEDFDQRYTSIDNLTPDDYNEEEEDLAQQDLNQGGTMSLTPNFDDVNYSDIEVEK